MRVWSSCLSVLRGEEGQGVSQRPRIAPEDDRDPLATSGLHAVQEVRVGLGGEGQDVPVQQLNLQPRGACQGGEARKNVWSGDPGRESSGVYGLVDGPESP